MFKTGESYSKKDIYSILKVPDSQQKGAWDTGYREYNNDIFIFANLGVPGRTGHDYNNFWDGSLLVWYAKNGSHVHQPSIQRMLFPNGAIVIFTRTDSRMPFTFQGKAFAMEVVDSSPVKIVWGFYE